MVRPINNSLRLEQYQKEAKRSAVLALVTVAALVVLLTLIHQKSSFKESGLPRIALITLSSLTGISFLHAIYRIRKLYKFADRISEAPAPRPREEPAPAPLAPPLAPVVASSKPKEGKLDLSGQPLAIRAAHAAAHATADQIIDASAALLTAAIPSPSSQCKSFASHLASSLKEQYPVLEVSFLTALKESIPKVPSKPSERSEAISPPEAGSFLYKVNQPYLEGAERVVTNASQGADKIIAQARLKELKERNAQRDHLYYVPLLKMLSNDQVSKDPFGALSVTLSPEIQAYYQGKNVLEILSKNIKKHLLTLPAYLQVVNLAKQGNMALLKAGWKMWRTREKSAPLPGFPVFPKKAIYNTEARKAFAGALFSFQMKEVEKRITQEVQKLIPQPTTAATINALLLSSLKEIEPSLKGIIEESAEKMTLARGKQIIVLIDEMIRTICTQLDALAERPQDKLVTQAEILGLFRDKEGPFQTMVTKLNS